MSVGLVCLPGILVVGDERGSVELQHGVLWRGAGEWEHSLGWPARSGVIEQYNNRSGQGEI